MSATPPPLAGIAVRPMRADARRNREKVLEAARAVFAADGQDAQMPDIAKRAGVGVGTVYRHFPTKEALIEALARDHFERLADGAEATAAREGDPWALLLALVHTCGERCANDRGLAAAVGGNRDILADVAAEQHRLRAATTSLLERGKAAGQVRADATMDDVSMLMCSLANIADMENDGRDGFSWRRFADIAFEGLRAR